MEKIEIDKNALILGLIILLSGFVVMTLGSDTYSFWKIGVAPSLILVAFCVIAYAVMHNKRE